MRIGNAKLTFPDRNTRLVAACGRILVPGPELADSIDAENASPDPFISVRLNTLEDAELLTDEIYELEKPLCIVCDDAGVLEYMLKAYNGRALYDGSLPEETLSRLRDRYGLIT